MDPALVVACIALCGVIIGAFLNRSTQSKSWIREKRLAAYEAYVSACESLLRNPLSTERYVAWDEAHTRMLLLATWTQSQHLKRRRHFYEDVRLGMFQEPQALLIHDGYKTELLDATRRAIGARVVAPLSELLPLLRDAYKEDFRKRPVRTSMPFVMLAIAGFILTVRPFERLFG